MRCPRRFETRSRPHGSATITIDFKPDLDEATIAARLKRKPGQSLSTILRKGAGPHARRDRDSFAKGDRFPKARRLQAMSKAAPSGSSERPRSPGRSRTAGGVAWSEIDQDFMLKKRPGVFVAGEMIDWEAPTGGYLLQAASRRAPQRAVPRHAGRAGRARCGQTRPGSSLRSEAQQSRGRRAPGRSPWYRRRRLSPLSHHSLVRAFFSECAAAGFSASAGDAGAAGAV